MRKERELELEWEWELELEWKWEFELGWEWELASELEWEWEWPVNQSDACTESILSRVWPNSFFTLARKTCYGADWG